MPEVMQDFPYIFYVASFIFILALAADVVLFLRLRKMNRINQFLTGENERRKEENERLRFDNRKLLKQKLKNEDLLKSLQNNDNEEKSNRRKLQTRRFEMVTVLFADIQGFTRIAEEMNPEYLIDQLDQLFFYFDIIIEKYQIEKIKTIGDAYMCAGGLPRKNRTNPVEVILVGLEMQNYLNKLHRDYRERNTRIWDLRIGVHTGGVIAGAIGKKKISYDIWGDTVNIASRMESSGAIGKVNISANTYKIAEDFFVCIYRGKMPIKYKGDVDMYFVEGIKPELSIDRKGNKPNEEFRIKLALLQTEDIQDHVTEFMKKRYDNRMRFHNYKMGERLTKQADLLAHGEKLSDLDRLLVKTAAIFLLTGYAFTADNVANESIRYLKDQIPEYEYKHEQTTQMSYLIKSFYENKNLEDIRVAILMDAYYEYLGSFNYLNITLEKFKEFKALGKLTNLKDWWVKQLELLQNYRFLTATAQLLRDVDTEDQIRYVEQSLSDMKTFKR